MQQQLVTSPLSDVETDSQSVVVDRVVGLKTLYVS